MTYFTILAILFVFAALVIIFRPEGQDLAVISGTYVVTELGLSIQALVFIYTIGIFLLWRWIKTGKKNTPSLLWSLAFLIYGIVFIGMFFQDIGFAWADASNATLFFLYRQPMIIWAALMYLGIAKILNFSKKWQWIITSAILAIGYIWFAYSLLVVPNIEFTMYVYLYTQWTPLCVSIAYCFFLYGKQFSFLSPRIMALGFALLGISYLGWAPWHKLAVKYIYYLWFTVFVIGLAFTLIGYLLLPYEIAAKTKKTETTGTTETR